MVQFFSSSYDLEAAEQSIQQADTGTDTGTNAHVAADMPTVKDSAGGQSAQCSNTGSHCS
jgi:hypothetical protein